MSAEMTPTLAAVIWVAVGAGAAATVLILVLLIREEWNSYHERRATHEDERAAYLLEQERRSMITMVTQDEVKQIRFMADGAAAQGRDTFHMALEDLLPILALAEVHAAPDGVLTHDEKADELGWRVWEAIQAVFPGEAPPMDELAGHERRTVEAVFESMVSAITVMLSVHEARRRSEFLASAPPAGE